MLIVKNSHRKTLDDFLILRNVIMAFVISFATVSNLHADQRKMSLEDRVTYHRAMEAVIWGMPLVNMTAMRDGLKRDASVSINDVAYNSKVQTWEAQFTTNNNTTPYTYIFWNVSDGPVVIDIPATTKDVGLVGTLMDTWQRTSIQVGTVGFDSGLGGKYLILPPDYQGVQPSGYKAVKQKTNNGYTLLRPIIKGATPENLSKAETFIKKIKVYPYADVGKSPRTKHIDIFGKAIDGLPHFDFSYFEKLHAIIQEEPIEEKDLAFMGVLEHIGIEKGKPFNPTSEMKQLLDQAAKEALVYLQDNYLDRSGARYYDDKQWSNAVPDGAFSTEMDWNYPNYLDYDRRGAGYYAFYTSFRKAGAGSFYLKISRDMAGERINGSNKYKLRVDKNVPAKNFWSVVAYTVEDASWFDNQPKAGVASSDPGVEVNKDGTVTIYLGPRAPEGKEANWVPTTAGQEYFLYFRFYGPEKPLFTKEWQLNDIEKIN